jgi:uncharacterized protein YidB (DUF937 family)
MSRRVLAGGVIAASVFAGGIGGALLFTPQVSNAKVSTTASATSAPGIAPGGIRSNGGSDMLSTAATALGMTEADLRTALGSGKTLAQVAKDKGVDALVAKAKQRLRQAEADLPARITAMVNGTAPLGGGHRGGRGGARFGAGLDDAATALGITPTELRTALESGKTIAQVAKDKGVDVQKVIDALVAAGSAQIDQAVTAGKLTQAQATTRKAELKDRITALVNEPRRAGGHRFRHGRDADGASTTTGQGTGTSS